MTPSKCQTCGNAPPQKVIRNMKTSEGRAFWDSVKKSAAGVKDWPYWKRAFYKPDEKCEDCGQFLGYTSPWLGIG